MTEEQQQKRTSPFTLALISGAVAGFTVDVALHPLDTLRTRLQAEQGFWKAGGFRGVYRGVLSAAIGSAPGAALFFSTYETVKGLTKDPNAKEEHWLQHAFASSCGEIGACLVRVPTAVVTQNMQVGRFSSLTEALTSVYAKGGFRAFYVGYGTTVMREIPFSFIQFPIYERLKIMVAKFQGSECTASQGAVCGSAAGSIASALTTPLDVAKTRIMLESQNPDVKVSERRYNGTIQTLTHIAKEEGFMALWGGIGPRVFWITLGGFVFFGAYEHSTKALWKTGLWGSEYESTPKKA